MSERMTKIPAGEREPEAPPGPERVNILVVDDLPEKLLAYRSILEELGQNLVLVQSGEEALKCVLKEEFAVILLDVNMPGMDGFETASLIRRRKKSAHTPIIFLTAFTDDVYAEQGYASGAVDYLPTPVVPAILKTKVGVFIELSRMRKQAALQAEERAMRKAAESSVRRWAFLGEVSQALAPARTQRDVMRLLVNACIPFMGDVCIVRLSGQEGMSHTEWARVRQKDAEQEEFPEIPWFEEAFRRVLAAGQHQLLTDLPVPVTPGKPGSRAVAALSSLGCALMLPLVIGDQARGVLMFGRRRTEEAYSLQSISLARQLASRASVVLENIMLIERIQEADRRKDEFLGMLAHELRNPLGPISNAMYLLQMMEPKEPRLQQIGDIVERQVKHMSRLIDDLLDATRLARGKILLRRERCDLAGIVRQTAEDYRTIFDASGLRQDVTIPSDPVWVDGDPTRLVQAIGNLLHNAHKFTTPGGKITMRLERLAGPQAKIVVRDTGIGIEPAMLPHVFDVFRQAEQGLDRSQGGLGLGLALVKGLVELHGGSVTVASKGKDKGAEFTICLPVAASVGNKAPSAASVFPGRSGQYRILIIEDNRDTAESSRLLLSLEGHEVRTAHTGLAGLEIAREFHPQVILCDIGLPGMDGYQIARAIRQDPLLSGVHIIALTGYGREEDQRQARMAGFDMHFTKPIDYTQLRQALVRLFARENRAQHYHGGTDSPYAQKNGISVH